MADYLLPIADREALWWILSEEQTAFSAARAFDAARLRRGDRLFLYTTRGCFRNPTRDRGRVIALATVTEPSTALPEPVHFQSREYSVGVRFEIKRLALRRQGVELAPLVPELATFPDPASWSARIRRALAPLAERDGEVLARLLEEVAPTYPNALETYRP